VNPATALAAVLADELVRCGLREAVLAPGSRSTPLALALYDRAQAGQLRLHVRIDERSAAFLALGLGKASGRPAAVLCTSGTAAAHFHAAVIEAGEAGVPLLVLTADRPPELRGTGANQTIDQVKLYGSAVRWFCEVGVPESRRGAAGYWRSLACRAWAMAAGLGAGGPLPGPVHLNLALREPLVPDAAPGLAAATRAAGLGEAGDPAGPSGPAVGRDEAAADGSADHGSGDHGSADHGSGDYGAADQGAADHEGWPESLAGRPDGQPWTRFPARGGELSALEVPWAERGLVVCGDGDYDPAPLIELAAAAGWPVLAEPSSGARCGPNSLAAYPFLLGSRDFAAAHQPEIIVSAGRPGLSRDQLALLRGGSGPPPGRHVVLARHAGHWADPARTATDVAPAVRLTGAPSGHGAGAQTPWLGSWRRADDAARRAADEILDGEDCLTEPGLARDLAALLPPGALLWAASSMPVRDLDHHQQPRAGLRVLASRGASGIDGLVSTSVGAALAHQAAGGGPAAALLGDLAFLHDAPGLMLGPDEPRPDLCLIVVGNDGGGIFSMLEQAGLPGPFERVFGTPHGTDLQQVALAARLPYQRLERVADLAGALAGQGMRVAELRADRAVGARLRARLQSACTAALTALGH
jgi:2-succinyl-5-enolpyruvyl-6-hydroxy-3-cyclohexene-1-carboxylate synthase